MKTNVAMPSNVYVNRSGSPLDSDFIRHILDYQILKRYVGTDTRSVYLLSNHIFQLLTPVQHDILKRGNPKCSLETGSMSWGVPVGGVTMQCRCEETACKLYPTCSRSDGFKRIERSAHLEKKPSTTIVTQERAAVVHEVQTTWEQHIASISPSASNAESTSPEVSLIDDVQPLQTDYLVDEHPLDEHVPMRTSTTDTAPLGIDFQYLDAPDVIISAPINSRIWVNAGPGTGKTYTVVRRLEYLLSQEDDERVILVLCFSRSAVQVICERLSAEIPNVNEMIAQNRLIIRTFDSFATYLLSDEVKQDSGYEERIEQFTGRIRQEPSLLEMVSYLVVDELQDVVGVRADMVREILSCMRGGVLVLGDSCQAIYDWYAREQGGTLSAEMVAWLAEQSGCMRYELRKNHRQPPRLQTLANRLRDALLYAEENAQEQAYQSCHDELSAACPPIEAKALSRMLDGRRTLILCRNNGQVASVSQMLLLHASSVPHRVAQPAGQLSLAPWIGLLLSGCEDGRMEKAHFLALAANAAILDSEHKWAVLKAMDGHSRSPVLHIQEVLRAIQTGHALPAETLCDRDESAVVSTIHRAKGLEANHVFWLNAPLVYDNRINQEGAKADALRVAYVAITRARENIVLFDLPSKCFMARLEDGHWIRRGKGRNGKTYFYGIAFHPEDIDQGSFAQSDAQSNAAERQEMIKHIAVGQDTVQLSRNYRDLYDIFFDGTLIGHMTHSFTRIVWSGVHSTETPYALPQVITAYVTRVMTVIGAFSDQTDEVYRKSGCWLGLELGGIGKAEWA